MSSVDQYIAFVFKGAALPRCSLQKYVADIKTELAFVDMKHQQITTKFEEADKTYTNCKQKLEQSRQNILDAIVKEIGIEPTISIMPEKTDDRLMLYLNSQTKEELKEIRVAMSTYDVLKHEKQKVEEELADVKFRLEQANEKLAKYDATIEKLKADERNWLEQRLRYGESTNSRTIDVTSNDLERLNKIARNIGYPTLETPFVLQMNVRMAIEFKYGTITCVCCNQILPSYTQVISCCKEEGCTNALAHTTCGAFMKVVDADFKCRKHV